MTTRLFTKSIAIVTIFVFIKSPVLSEELTDDFSKERYSIESLLNEISTLKKRDNDQVRALNILLERIKKMEAQEQANTDRSSVKANSSRPTTSSSQSLASKQSVQTSKEVDHGEQSVAEDGGAGNKEIDSLISYTERLFHRRLSIESGFNYSHFDRQQLMLSGFLALDAIFLGRMSVDEVVTDVITWQTGIRYGFANWLQMDVQIPYLFRQTLYRSGGAEGASNKISEEMVNKGPALGDISFGYNIRLFQETLDSPGVSLILRAKMPTGTSPYGVDIIEVEGANGNLSVPNELPTSNGVWSVNSALSFTRTVDPAVLFASLGGTYNFTEDFDDIDSNPNTESPGSVRLGHSVQLGMGIGYALNERTSVTMAYSHQFQDTSETRYKNENWQVIAGSRATSATFNNTVTYALNRHWTLITTLGIGLTKDASDINFGSKFTYLY